MLIATLDIRKIHIVLLGGSKQESGQHLIGIGMPLVDVIAAVSAQEIVDGYLKEEVILGHCHLFIFKGSVGAHTSGTADKDFALVFRVEVEQDVAIHEAALHGIGSSEASLLIHRKHTLYRTVLDAIVGEHSKSRSYTDAIVGTQGSAIGLEPFTVNDEADGVVHKIVVNTLVAFAHHIHVRLQDDGLAVLHARSSRFGDDYIAGLIDLSSESARLTKSLQVGSHLLFMFRWAGNATNLLKVAKQGCRFQVFCLHICLITIVCTLKKDKSYT